MIGDLSPERLGGLMRECPGASPREASAPPPNASSRELVALLAKQVTARPTPWKSEVTPPLTKSGLSLHRLSEQTGRLVVNMEPLAWHHTKQTPF